MSGERTENTETGKGVVGFTRLAAVHGAAAAVGFGVAHTAIPMPWLIGPMVLASAHGIMFGRLDIPRYARPTGQMIVAAVIGTSFTATAFAAFLDHFLAMLVIALGAIFSGFAAAAVLAKISRVDPMSAIIASVPGGPVEMSAFAETYGVPPAPVAFVQALRITLLVLTIPSLVVLISGTTPDPAGALINVDRDAVGAIILLALALAGGLGFKVLRFTSPYFLGALGVSAAATISGLPVSLPPYWLICLAQILLGVSLGNMFEQQLFRDMRKFLLAACASTAVLVILSSALAIAISETTGIPWHTMILSAAPGSVTEMALTARLLHDDVALVVAFHLVRIFIVIPLAPLVFGLSVIVTRRWTQSSRTTETAAKTPARHKEE